MNDSAPYAPFVSHAREDFREAELISTILDMHGLLPWLAKASLEPGDDYRSRIADAIEEADSLLVLVSDNALRSPWVTSEVTSFTDREAGRLVLPVCLDSTAPREVQDRLDIHQFVDLQDSYVSGLREILSVFGKEFFADRAVVNQLPGGRQAAERRAGQERRQAADRRKVNVQQRFRKGIEYNVLARLGFGNFSGVPKLPSNFIKLFDGILLEIESRYRFFDPEADDDVPAETALRTSMNEAWASQRGTEALEKGAVYFTEFVTRVLFRTYSVLPIDRRASDRRTDRDRREQEGNGFDE